LLYETLYYIIVQRGGVILKKKIVNQTLIDRMNQLNDEGHATLDEIEEAIGISKGSLSKYMNGIHLPNSEVVRKLAKYWKVSADYLLGSSDDRSLYMTDGEDIPNSYVDVVRETMNAGITAEELKEMVETIKRIKGVK
jgi:transcriptional regulator with XRE-family HTH domain